MDAPTTWVYIGGYTHTMPFVQGKAPGITVCRLDHARGTLIPTGTAAGITNPSYLTVDPRHRYLYCVEEHAFGVREIGEVSAFRIDPATGMLTHLNRQPSYGAEPAHLSMDREGQWLLVANYGSGSVAVPPVQADGSLGPATDVVQHTGESVHPERQRGPHAHWICADPANQFVLVSDLGLDAILVYRLDHEQGKLLPTAALRVNAAPGAGPRHAVFRPDGRFLYLVHELDSTIAAYRYDPADGRLSAIQRISTLPAGHTGTSAIAAVRVTPDGRFVYASNRGHDSIGMFGSDPATGQLEYLGHQSTQGLAPRDFNIDPEGTFLLAANQDGDTIVTFQIDRQTGKITPTGDVAAINTPVCLEFCPID
jgi:6-phosphogluconolactonase